ncbi:MAG: hypothetical protein P4M07_21725 [Xanthobacteraceae bacterium]|nr:hypothetical protein [Xanthobacteraceae bacterium]
MLFQTDPDRFWDVVSNENPKERVAALESIDDMLLCEVLRYGLLNRTEMISPLASLYRDLFMQVPVERRFEVSRHASAFVDQTTIVSANALLPFIAEDTEAAIVSSAVIDYVSFSPLTNNDPMSRVKDIIGMIESAALKNEGAAFGALLHIGDRRACKLLWPLRDSLDGEALKNATKCSTGLIHAGTVDFYLDWLEGMEGTDVDGKFGIVASGLALLKKTNQSDQVFTGHRPFPARGATPAQWMALQKPMPLADYARRIAPRMYALERTEPPPRVMPHVLLAWELQPRTDREDIAVLDDRAATATALVGPEPVPSGRIVDVTHEWWDGEGQIVLTWGILNPNGPTLYVLGIRKFDDQYRTFFRWMHMLGGCTTYAAEAVDRVTYQGIYEDALNIDDHLVRNGDDGLFHVIPHFLIPVGGEEEVLLDIAKRLLAGGAAAKGDWGESMAYTRQFGSDFFGRAGAKIRSIYETLVAEARSKGEEPSEFLKFTKIRYGDIPDFADAKIPTWTSARMTPLLLEEWLGIISPRGFQVQALVALKQMWEGALKVLPEREGTIPWQRVMEFLDIYGFSLSEQCNPDRSAS